MRRGLPPSGHSAKPPGAWSHPLAPGEKGRCQAWPLALRATPGVCQPGQPVGREVAHVLGASQQLSLQYVGGAHSACSLDGCQPPCQAVEKWLLNR